MEIESRIRVARAEYRLAREARKPDVGLSLSASWQGEDADGPIGRERILTEEHVGSEVAVVWTQPLGYRRERAELEARRLRIEALREERRQSELRITADLGAARDAVRSARTRLRLISTAVDEATRALRAEEERFHMGEGRSRHVLDAQKDLNTAARRHISAAAALLGAFTDLRYAAGYAPGTPGNASHADRGEDKQ